MVLPKKVFTFCGFLSIITYNILNPGVSEFIKTLKIDMDLLKELFKKTSKMTLWFFHCELRFLHKEQASPPYTNQHENWESVTCCSLPRGPRARHSCSLPPAGKVSSVGWALGSGLWAPGGGWRTGCGEAADLFSTLLSPRPDQESILASSVFEATTIILSQPKHTLFT